MHSVEKKLLDDDNNRMSTEYSIANARKKDSGVYTCRVTNKFGSLKSLQIQVEVEETTSSNKVSGKLIFQYRFMLQRVNTCMEKFRGV